MSGGDAGKWETGLGVVGGDGEIERLAEAGSWRRWEEDVVGPC